MPGTYVARGFDDRKIARTQIFNIDNGNGTTIDETVLVAARPILIHAARIVYDTETSAAGVTSANIKIGTAVAGEEIVASTAYEAKAVGLTTALTLVATRVASGFVVVRHTGVATTVAGQAHVEVEWSYL